MNPPTLASENYQLTVFFDSLIDTNCSTVRTKLSENPHNKPQLQTGHRLQNPRIKTELHVLPYVK